MLRESLVNDIASAWQEKVNSFNGVRMKKNELSALIQEKKEAHELTDVDVSCALICQHMRKNKPIFPPHAGIETSFKKYIVSLMEQLA
jgi:hypothetical protein